MDPSFSQPLTILGTGTAALIAGHKEWDLNPIWPWWEAGILTDSKILSLPSDAEEGAFS